MSQTKAELIDAKGDANFDSGTLYVDATNNRVGIGASDPQRPLDVVSNSSAETVTFRGASANNISTLRFNSNNAATNYASIQSRPTFFELATAASVPLVLSPGSGTGVGIGTQSPNSSLNVVADSGAVGLTIQNRTANDYGYLRFQNNAGTETQAYIGCERSGTSAGRLLFETAGSERARLDETGRLLVGTSTSATGGSSAYARLQVRGNHGGTAAVIVAGSSSVCTSISNNQGLGYLIFTDNEAAQYAWIGCEADGASSSSSDTPGRLTFATTPNGSGTVTERFRIDSNGYLRAVGTSGTARVIPHVDNVGYVGQSSERWQAIYAVNGTIQTSDRRQKTDITEALLGSDFIKTLKPVSYKWIEGGKEPTGEIDENGDQVFTSIPGQRTHWGFIAQDVKEAVDAAGVDFGGWLLDDKDDPNSQQALRYDQFIAPLTKALQEALAEIDVLKSKVAALESA